MTFGTGFAPHEEVSGEDDPSWQGCSFQDPFPWDAGSPLPALGSRTSPTMAWHFHP